MNMPTPETAQREVDALMERRRTAQAKERLKHFLQVYPDHPELLLLLGRVEYTDDNNEVALSIAQQVLSQDPDNADARELLFDVLKDEERFAEAERIILGLLQDYPEHAPFYGEYAMLMVYATRLPKARTLAEEGLQRDPDELNSLTARLLCDAIERRKEAQNHSLQQIIVRHPDSLHTLAVLVFILRKRGDDRGALRIAQELLRAHPDDEDFLEMVLILKKVTHWSMFPVKPLVRWGLIAFVPIWVGGVEIAVQVGHFNEMAGYCIAWVLIGYTAYCITMVLLIPDR